MFALRLFFRLIVRPLRREPLRAALTALAVGLGVAVVLAIDLAGQAAAGSFRSSVETLAGDADLEISAAGGVPASVAGTLARMPYPIEIRPRMEDYAEIPGTGHVMPLIGVDVFNSGRQTGQTQPTGPEGAPNPEENRIWLGVPFHKKAGDTMELRIGDREVRFTVAGTLEERSGDAAVIDLALADRLLRRGGRLDRILIRLPGQGDAGRRSIEEWERLLRGAVPSGITVERSGAKTRENRKMLEAFRWNLRLLSYIALIVGAFLIYNTISVSVVRRRAEIGVVRALGADRRLILGAFVAESAMFGLAGSLLGIALGRVMAEGAVRLVAATVESLYVSSTPAPIALTAGAAAFAILLGVAMSVVSGFVPAREASMVPPTEAMARGRVDYQARTGQGRGLAASAAALALATAAAFAGPVDGKPVLGYIAALLLVVAGAAAIPSVVSFVCARAGTPLGRLFGVEAMLASRSLLASLRRTSVLAGALSTAIAMMVAVGIMVGSFRETVLVWMDNQLKADLYLRPAGPAAVDRHPTLSAMLAERVAALPEVRAVEWFRAYDISYEGMPAILAGADMSVSARFGRLVFMGGADPAAVYARLRQGDAVAVSEPFANKHHVGRGATIRLNLAGRAAAFPVAGVYYDYASERGYVLMDRATLLRYLPDPAPSNLAVYLAEGVELGSGRAAVERACAGRQVAIFANRSLRREAIRVFDRTFAITYALEGVAILVAVMGVAGALLALVIDRRREMGLLRFLGGSVHQLRRLILFEAGLLGLLSSAIGLGLGGLLSLILIFVINKQSFGWTIQFHLPVSVLGGAVAVVLFSTVLSALYPAGVAMRLNPIEVVHEE